MTDVPTQQNAAEKDFTDRIAKLRVRFATKLADRLVQTTEALPRMSGNGSEAVDAVVEAYRQFHDICGIAPAIGFPETGRLARCCDDILVIPFRAGRALSENETAMLTTQIESLRVGAQSEMHSSLSDRS